MPRYMVQRTFPEGLHIPVENGGAEACSGVVERNAEEGVTWIGSYVSDDKTRTFCVYDAPTPEAIRKTAARNELLLVRECGSLARRDTSDEFAVIDATGCRGMKLPV